MQILRTLTRVYVHDIDQAIRFYEELSRSPVGRRVAMPAAGLELAQVGNVLILAGTDDALRPFRATTATFLVDSLEDYHRVLTARGATVIRPPQKVPTGVNMTVRHPDGSIIEYVEFRKNE